jgi:hypothetical protein
MKWAADGELSVQDLELVLQRLAEADQKVLPLDRSPAAA